MDGAIAFTDRASLRAWLDAHHGTARELLVLIAKAGTGVPSVTWEDCVVEAIRAGWIDGVKRSAGPGAWVQRLTPRRKGSAWSERNRGHADRLIAGGSRPRGGQNLRRMPTKARLLTMPGAISALSV